MTLDDITLSPRSYGLAVLKFLRWYVVFVAMESGDNQLSTTCVYDVCLIGPLNLFDMESSSAWLY